MLRPQKLTNDISWRRPTASAPTSKLHSSTITYAQLRSPPINYAQVCFSEPADFTNLPMWLSACPYVCDCLFLYCAHALYVSVVLFLYLSIYLDSDLAREASPSWQVALGPPRDGIIQNNSERFRIIWIQTHCLLSPSYFVLQTRPVEFAVDWNVSCRKRQTDLMEKLRLAGGESERAAC